MAQNGLSYADVLMWNYSLTLDLFSRDWTKLSSFWSNIMYYLQMQSLRCWISFVVFRTCSSVLLFFGKYPAMDVCPLLPEYHGSAMFFDRSRKLEKSSTKRINSWFGSNRQWQFVPIWSGSRKKGVLIGIDTRWQVIKVSPSEYREVRIGRRYVLTGTAARPWMPLYNRCKRAFFLRSVKNCQCTCI